MRRHRFAPFVSVLTVAIVMTGIIRAQTPAHWNGGTGNWTTAALWSGGVVPNNGTPPGSTYDAFIDAAGTYTVTLNSPITVTNLTMNDASATLTVSNTLTIVNSTTLTAGAIQLSGGTIMGGTMTSAGGRLTATNSFSNNLSGVTIGSGVLDLASSFSRLQLTNGSNFSGPGTVALANGSQLFLNEGVTIPSGTVFTLTGGTSLSADGGTSATLAAATTDTVTVNMLGSGSIGAGYLNNTANSVLVNQGRIQFDPTTVNSTLTISAQGAGSRFRNEGKLVASSTGAANTINMSSFTNAGTLIAATGGVINLTGTFTRADLGTFTNTGGTITIGGTLNNTALALDDTTGSVFLTGGTIASGTLSATGAARLRASNSFSNNLSGVTISGANVIDLASSFSRLQWTNGTNYSGAGTVAIAAGSSLYLNEGVTIPTGVVFTLAGSPSLSADAGTSATLAAATTDTVTVNMLGSGSIGAGYLNNTANSVLVNQGRIQFDPTTVNSTLTISAQGAGSRFRNEGKLVASSTGAANTINMSSFTNAGTLIAATGGVINLTGTFTRADLGTFTNTGGTITIGGTLNNTALALDDTTGSVFLTGGTIASGTLSATGAARLRASNSFSNNLSGVTISGANVIDLASSFSRLQWTNGTNYSGAGTVAIAAGSSLYLNEGVTIPTGVVFTLAGSPSLSADAGTSATLAAATTDTVTVNMLGSGSIGAGYLNNTANSVLVNQGRIQFDPTTVNSTLTISAQGAGSRFRNEGKLVASSTGAANTINMSSFTNAGTLIAATGGVINLTGTFTRADLGTFTNTGGTITIGGTLNNTALALDDTTGSVFLTGGTIASGTLSATGAARLRASNSFSNNLSGVTISGANVIDLASSFSRLQWTNGTNYSGAGTVAIAAGSSLYLNEGVTIPTGVVFTIAGSASLSADGGVSATLAATTTDTITVNMLGSGFVGAGYYNNTANSVLVNQGKIQFDPTTVNSTLTISAQGAGSRFRNEGKLVAGSTGSTNTINMSSFTNAGTLIAATNGVINLNGTFTRTDLGIFTNTGGTITIGGTLNNTALALDDTTGSIFLTSGGTIAGGTLSATGAARLRATNSSSNNLSGVTISGANVIDLASSFSRLQWTNGTNYSGAGTVAIAAGSSLYLNEGVTIPTGVVFTLAGNSSLSADGGTSATLAAATIDTVTVNMLGSGSIGAGFFNSTPNSVLINQGRIQFDPTAAGATLTITSQGAGSSVQNAGVLTANVSGTNVTFSGSTTFTNIGTLTAVNGGTVNIPAAATLTNYNAGTQTLTGGTYQVFASSVINFNGRTVTTLGAGTSILMDGASSVFTAATNTITTNNGTFSIGNGKLNTVPGGTFTNNGTLIVGTTQGDAATFTGNVNVGPSGFVKGTGTIAGGISLVSGSTLAPGGSPGVLTVNGAVNMAAGSTFSVALNGNVAGTSGYSQLNVTGGAAVNLNNATLGTTVGYAPLVTDTFTIINGGAISGTFNGLPNNALVILGTFNGNQYKATIVYSANMVQLVSPVPEPAHVMLFGTVGLGAASWIRRRITSRRAAPTDTPLSC